MKLKLTFNSSSSYVLPVIGPIYYFILIIGVCSVLLIKLYRVVNEPFPIWSFSWSLKNELNIREIQWNDELIQQFVHMPWAMIKFGWDLNILFPEVRREGRGQGSSKQDEEKKLKRSVFNQLVTVINCKPWVKFCIFIKVIYKA